MLDPKEKTRREEAQNKKPSSGTEVDISKNMNVMATKRAEIFGPSDRSFQLPPEPKKDVTIWDGQNESMTRTTASFAMIENEKRKLAEALRSSANKK